MELVELLKQALEIKGVTSASVASTGGALIEGVSREDMDLGFVGGLITSGLASSKVLSALLGEGEMNQTMIEYERGPVLLTPLGSGDADDAEGFVSVITLDNTASLGRARFQLRKLLPDIAKAVSS